MRLAARYAVKMRWRGAESERSTSLLNFPLSGHIRNTMSPNVILSYLWRSVKCSYTLAERSSVQFLVYAHSRPRGGIVVTFM